jgi:hypothetical protein
MAQDIDTIVIAPELEVTICGVKPSIKHLSNFDTTLPEVKSHGGLIASIARMTFHHNR